MTERNDHALSEQSPYIGYIVGGTLKANLNVRLTVPPHQVQLGSFVVVESDSWMFYGLITDLQLGSTDPRFADEQSEVRLPPELARLLHGQTLYTNLELMPALMLNCGPGLESPDYDEWRDANPDETHPQPVRTVPAHHALVRLASAGDVAEIFGKPDDDDFFVIGTTKEQDHPICINLKKFVQRSSGIFGATGTGKSFLTRIILAGLIKYDQSSVLVFDMHNEYGFDDSASDNNQKVTGLKSKFSNVRVVGLGAGSQIRGNSPDFNLVLSEKDIQPEDIGLLAGELNLTETTSATLEALVTDFGRTKWFHEFKNMKTDRVIENEEGKMVPAPGTVEAWAGKRNVHVQAAKGLHNKLGRVFNKPYIVEDAPSDSFGEVIKGLEKGLHYVISFGEHETDLDYLLVSNLLTRRIRSRWEQLTNEARGHDKETPRPLVIVIEEAHKLLNREMASQTIFSTIAREMRKYYVTLLVVDQRPSQIYDEVMSQLGTRISGWLGDDADIQAVLSGLAAKDSLRGMLATLEQTKEVLLLGWGVPMPLPVRSIRYDDIFWKNLLGDSSKRPVEDILDELGF